MDFRASFRDSSFFRIAACTLMILALIYESMGKKRELNWDFKGPVQEVLYDEKGFPTIVIKGKKYDLFHLIWHFNIKIHKGDIVLKKKGDRRIKVIFRNSKDTVFFDDREF